MGNKFLTLTFIALMGLLIVAAIVKLTLNKEVSVTPKCNDGISRDVTEDGTPRVTYIPANDTCKEEK